MTRLFATVSVVSYTLSLTMRLRIALLGGRGLALGRGPQIGVGHYVTVICYVNTFIICFVFF